ncbi:hypothetical protein ACIQF6_23540 [Kitasatospora sp. NPDC092948]|uniref:hypothetical protein n=1 Tax=Kitasatospora sp. NPDC092948 TaxID=3364088 RepID=UPI003811D278
MDDDGLHEPNPWALPAAALGAGLLLAGFARAWLRLPTLPLAVLGLPLSVAGLVNARRTGSSRWTARLGFLLCSLAALAGLVAVAVVLGDYDGL